MFGFRLRKDKRGLSLVELICALAILGIITGTVGGAMVVATNSYRQGTVETSLQQEAQFTQNLIESLIIDATKSVETVPALAAGEAVVTTNRVTIKNDDDNYYVIDYDASTQRLTYTEYRGGNVYPDDASVNQLLAEHVSDFKVDARNFENDRNVIITIGMENERSNFTTVYNVTSRNNPNQGTNALAESARIMVEKEIVLEPNESCLLPVSVSGSATDYKVGAVNYSTAGSTAVKATGGVQIDINANETADYLEFQIDTDPEITAASQTVKVYIRRVNAVQEKVFSGNGDVGDTYTISAADLINGQHMPITSYSTDYYPNAYVNPVKMKWEVLPEAQAYVEIVGAGNTSLEDSVTIRVKQELPKGKAKYVKATAIHPNGKEGTDDTNKTGLVYGPETSYHNFIYIDVPNLSDAGLGRGRYSIVYPWGKDKDPLTELKNLTGKNISQIQTYKCFARYTETAESYALRGGTIDQSPGYSSNQWYKIGETGLNGTTINDYGNGKFGAKIRVWDFINSPHNPYYMSDYKVDMIFGLYYQYTDPVTGDSNCYRWYPEELNDVAGYQGGDTRKADQNLSDTITLASIASGPSVMLGNDLPAVSFDYYKVASGSKEISLTGLTTSGRLGDYSTPVEFSKSEWENAGDNYFYFYVKVNGAAADGSAFKSIIEDHATITDCNDGTTKNVRFFRQIIDQQDDATAASGNNRACFRFNDQNEARNLFNALTVGHTYRISFGDFNGRGTEDFSGSLIGNERGAIFFKLTN